MARDGVDGSVRQQLRNLRHLPGHERTSAQPPAFPPTTIAATLTPTTLAATRTSSFAAAAITAARAHI